MEYVRKVYPVYQPARLSLEEMTAIAVPSTHVRTIIPEPLGLPGERGRAVRTFQQLERDATFARRVLEAYGNRCAICGYQLRLLDAAHIVPVADSLSTDRTENGLALCPTHHRAFDRGIIGIAEDGTIVVNEAKITRLRTTGYAGGLTEFLEWSRVGRPYHAPTDLSKTPTPETLRSALRLRGFRPALG
jgi:putative restriction endonuclease